MSDKTNPRTFSLFRGRIPTHKDVWNRSFDRPVMVFDESSSTGPLGSDESDPRPIFTLVSTYAEDQGRFKKVTSAFPKKRKGEFKYSDASLKDAKPIFKELLNTDFSFSERHRSRRNETFSNTDNVKEFYVGAISEMIDEGNPGVPFDVIIDEPPVEVGSELTSMCRSKLDDGMGIEWFEIKRSAEDHVLQVNDFITGAVGDHMNGITKKSELYDMIKDRKR